MIGGMWSQRRSRPRSESFSPADRLTTSASRPLLRPAHDLVVVAPLEAVIAASDGVALGRPGEARAPQARPAPPRRRPSRGEAAPPVLHPWPPGLASAFGVDLGPAFLYIGTWALAKWGVTVETLAERSVANVRARAVRHGERGLIRDTVGGMPMTAFQ